MTTWRVPIYDYVHIRAYCWLRLLRRSTPRPRATLHPLPPRVTTTTPRRRLRNRRSAPTLAVRPPRTRPSIPLLRPHTVLRRRLRRGALLFNASAAGTGTSGAITSHLRGISFVRRTVARTRLSSIATPMVTATSGTTMAKRPRTRAIKSYPTAVLNTIK